jgi:hypothetical protein
MIRLMQRGYIPGGGMLSTDKSTFVLSIPKNASTYLTNVLTDNKWRYSNIAQVSAEITSPVKCIVILRDPIDRWVSGFATYCSSHILKSGYTLERFAQDYNELSERLIFDNLQFDDHTEPQVTFVNQLNSQFQKEYVLLGQDHKQLIKTIASIHGHPLSAWTVDKNQSNDNLNTKIILEFIRERLTTNLKTKIINSYHKDYELLKQVLSYEPR